MKTILQKKFFDDKKYHNWCDSGTNILTRPKSNNMQYTQLETTPQRHTIAYDTKCILTASTQVNNYNKQHQTAKH